MTQKEHDAAQTVTKPPSSVTGGTCGLCGGFYLDAPAGHEAHQVVFGHQPEKDNAK